jgi:hypothetical protein
MHDRARWTLALCGAWLFASPPSEAASAQRGCVVVRAIARYAAAGYNHIATTENTCTRPVRCELWTDVDPEPQHVVELEPRESEDTVFRLDSPAYTFVAHYRCRYR